MYNDQAKTRGLKLKSQLHPPLIPNRKQYGEIKQKQNDKHSADHAMKNKYIHTEYEHQNNKHNINYQYQTQNHHIITQKQKYINFQNNTGLTSQPAKGLTFATVKNNKNHGHPLPQTSSFINIQQQKKMPVHPSKNNLLFQKQKPIIVQKPYIQKKQINKPTSFNKNSTITMPTCIQDFLCTQQLEFKPVEKKSLIPDKKFQAQKTTSKFDFPKIRKQKKIDKNELKQFQIVEKQINNFAQGQNLMTLRKLQQQYAVDSAFLQKTQAKTANMWLIRATLVDWMRHVCYQFRLLRVTYHIAVVLLDNYLAKTPNLQKSVLQAIGATTLFIASKLQQFQCPQSIRFAQSTNYSCTQGDIHDLQLKIVKTLKFRLNPPTVSGLANTLMSQWDIFINSGISTNHIQGLQTIKFKETSDTAYRLFRELMQLIDCAIMDVQTAQYKPAVLVSSFMYLLIGVELRCFSRQQVAQLFPTTSRFLLQDNEEYNDYFDAFITQVMGFQLTQILPSAQYCATYFQLGFTYQAPSLREQQNLQSMSMQQYCSFQTYNSSMLKYVKNRFRGIYQIHYKN